MSSLSAVEFYDAKSLPLLGVHLAEWIQVLKMYIENVEESSPFGYRERTQVGFFAAASWRLGVPALEEWSTTKGTKDAPSKGRCDLWIKTGDFHIEAKHAWCDVSRGRALEMARVEKAVNESKASARWLAQEVEHRLAFTFLAPCIARNKLADIESLTAQWLSLVTSISSDAIAWYLPERHRQKPFDFPYLAIGSVLLIHKP